MRLFLGIPIAHENRTIFSQMSERQPLLAGAKWVAWENFHLTIYFFGNTPPEQLGNLISLIQVGLSEFNSFSLEFEEYVYAPKGKTPRMIWAQYKKNETFRKLVGRMHELFSQIQSGNQVRKNPIPHVTLARLREMEEFPNLNVFPRIKQDFPVKNLCLWESQLHDSGPVYTQLETFQLSG